MLCNYGEPQFSLDEEQATHHVGQVRLSTRASVDYIDNSFVAQNRLTRPVVPSSTCGEHHWE